MTGVLQQGLRFKRHYDVRPEDDGHYSVQFSGQVATLSRKTWDAYKDITAKAYLKDASSDKTNTVKSGLLTLLGQNGLTYRVEDIPAAVTGIDFHDKYFESFLKAWLYKAFSHKFWDLMMKGEGSSRLYAGWLFELYHYTKNANRHMPLAAATCSNKAVKSLFAKHYREEWNHFHFFERALRAMDFSKEDIVNSKPLPMTMEMSNFMREAARRDSVAYAICSAVLEGTTVDRNSFNPFYEAVKEHYGVPREAVQPIYDHLDLDVKYQHSNLFREICEEFGEINAQHASLILSYGHQMAEHIWMWTDNIWNYYSKSNNSLPNKPFDICRD